MTQDRASIISQLGYLKASIPAGFTGTGVPITPTQSALIQQQLGELMRITVVEAPTADPSLIKRGLDRQRIESQLIQSKVRLDHLRAGVDLSCEPSRLRERLSVVTRELSSLREKNALYQSLVRRMNELEERIKHSQAQVGLNPGPQIEALGKEMEDHTRHLAMAEKIQLFLDRQDALKIKQDELLQLHTKLTKDHARVTNLQRFKTLAIEIECRSHQSTVDTINQAIADVATIIFEDPIEITLSLFKTSKSTDRVKQNVNIRILYKGGEYDNPSQLSGGEGDRISLAITLALARLNSCPFLLLDESMVALDAGLKDQCFRALRGQICGSKTIISIAHDFVEGIFDRVYDLAAPGGGPVGPVISSVSV